MHLTVPLSGGGPGPREPGDLYGGESSASSSSNREADRDAKRSKTSTSTSEQWMLYDDSDIVEETESDYDGENMSLSQESVNLLPPPSLPTCQVSITNNLCCTRDFLGFLVSLPQKQFYFPLSKLTPSECYRRPIDRCSLHQHQVALPLLLVHRFAVRRGMYRHLLPLRPPPLKVAEFSSVLE